MLSLLRLLSRLPLPVLYALTRLAGFVGFRLAGWRADVIATNLAKSFPELDAAALAALGDRHRRGMTEVLAETIKALSIGRDELAARVALTGLEAPRERLRDGGTVMFVTNHHANWEWLLLRLSDELGTPVHALYKPMKSAWADRAFLALRSRFGARMIPAKEIVPAVLQRRAEVKALALLGDQVPTSSPGRYWTRFLNQDTAFYLGPEEIARALGCTVYYIDTARTARGRYAGRVVPLGGPGDGGERPKELTRRYVAALEATIRAEPADWLWGHRRWKLKKPLYAR